MTQTLDTIDFVLAEKLGKSLNEIRSLPASEVEEWRAFYAYRSAMQELQDKKAENA